MELELRFDDESMIKRNHQVTGHFLNYTCERCGGHCLTTVGEGLLTHPAIISFFYEHGRDITEIPLWELDFCMDDRMVTVISDDPLRMTIDIELDEEGLQLTVDEHLSVLNIKTTTL